MSQGTVIRPSRPERPPPFEVRETFWGYVIRSTDGAPVLLQMAQGVVLGIGAAMTGVALVLVLTPTPGAEGLSGIRMGLSVALGAVALLLMWFATRGALVELHVDVARGELREIVRHRAGRPTTLGRHGFDATATFVIDRGGPPDAPRSLVLRLQAEGPGICIARGPEQVLVALRHRLERDLMLRPPLGTADRAAA